MSERIVRTEPMSYNLYDLKAKHIISSGGADRTSISTSFFTQYTIGSSTTTYRRNGSAGLVYPFPEYNAELENIKSLRIAASAYLGPYSKVLVSGYISKENPGDPKVIERQLYLETPIVSFVFSFLNTSSSTSRSTDSATYDLKSDELNEVLNFGRLHIFIEILYSNSKSSSAGGTVYIQPNSSNPTGTYKNGAGFTISKPENEFYVNNGTSFSKADPYVLHNGVWTTATASRFDGTQWKDS